LRCVNSNFEGKMLMRLRDRIREICDYAFIFKHPCDDTYTIMMYDETMNIKRHPSVIKTELVEADGWSPELVSALKTTWKRCILHVNKIESAYELLMGNGPEVVNTIRDNNLGLYLGMIRDKMMLGV
jgi:hypothetical protein